MSQKNCLLFMDYNNIQREKASVKEFLNKAHMQILLANFAYLSPPTPPPPS